jgi:hypothetical protein
MLKLLVCPKIHRRFLSFGGRVKLRKRVYKIALMASALIVSACASSGGGGTQISANQPASAGGNSSAGGDGGLVATAGGSGSAWTIDVGGSSYGDAVIISRGGGEETSFENAEYFYNSGNVFFGGDFAVGAPDPATSGENATPIVIADGGDTPAEGTAFPLIQSAIEITETGIVTDGDTNDGGATLTVVDFDTGETELSIPSLGINVVLTANADSPTEIADGFVALAGAVGNYLMVGSWGAAFENSANLSFFVTGYRTPTDQLPTSGTASFSGTNNVAGSVLVETTGNAAAGGILVGDAAFNVNFSTGAVGGAFTNMIAFGPQGEPSDWNDVSVSATLGSAGGISTLSGTTAASNAPGTPFALSGAADGHINGGLFGPSAEELGAVWSLADGNGAALGTVAAGREGASGGGGAGIYATTSGGDVTIETSGNVSASGSYGINAYTSPGNVTVNTSGQ